MDTFKSFETQLYTINERSFEDIALSVFRFQARHNAVYRQYIENLRLSPDSVKELRQIPFLPIAFFKRHEIVTGSWIPVTEFRSSGTTAATTSRHLIRDADLYLTVARECFEHFYGKLTDYHILALLPSYLEQGNSSLVRMIDHFIACSQSPYSGFYLHNVDKLLRDIADLKKDGRKVLLWGVTFALLDIAEKFQPDLSHCMIFETGGMKGRRKEITREELHAFLCNRFNVDKIYSEYGMTELLSQAYTKGGATFFPGPTMKVIAREVTDPFQKGINDTGGLNVIDLANLHSIAFIETEDIGKVNEDGSFEVMGRMDNSDVRGCNLLVV